MSIVENKNWYNITNEQRKMYLGTLVTSKKTGLPAIGVIMSIMEPEWYSRAFKINLNTFKRWDNLYEGWKEKPLVGIVFRDAQKFISFVEFEEIHKEDKSPEWIRVHYDDLPLTMSAIYPIDDLELYDCPEDDEEENGNDN